MISAEKSRHDALDTMWSFLQMGGQKANISELKANCAMLQHMMMQRTAGQKPYAKRGDVDFGEIDAIVNSIVIEAMALYLSGELDK